MDIIQFSNLVKQCFSNESSGDISEPSKTLLTLKQTTEKIVLKPKDFQDFLIEQLRFTNDKAEVFIKSWSQKPNLILNKLAPETEHLEGIAWELYTEVAENSAIIKTPIVPKGRLQFFLGTNDTEKEGSISMDLDRDELVKFYTQLEAIQNVLDKIKDENINSSK